MAARHGWRLMCQPDRQHRSGMGSESGYAARCAVRFKIELLAQSILIGFWLAASARLGGAPNGHVLKV